MTYEEIPRCFTCRGEQLIGILHRPAKPASTGVLVVVGGPQYRVGSHRQFTLLARYLAGQGTAVFRFDYRSMGDSEGESRDFEDIDEDIATAIDHFFSCVPELSRVVIWGLCDAASAALFYAHRDSRVTGLVLLNPWIRTEAGEARAYLRHYYAQRLLSGDFWNKVLSGKWRPGASFSSFLETLKRSRAVSSPSGDRVMADNPPPRSTPLPERMAYGLQRFKGNVLLILSGNNDYVADEFRDMVAESPHWQRLLSRPSVERRDFPQANHTFSKQEWRDQVAAWTWEWLTSLPGRNRP